MSPFGVMSCKSTKCCPSHSFNNIFLFSSDVFHIFSAFAVSSGTDNSCVLMSSGDGYLQRLTVDLRYGGKTWAWSGQLMRSERPSLETTCTWIKLRLEGIFFLLADKEDEECEENDDDKKTNKLFWKGPSFLRTSLVMLKEPVHNDDLEWRRQPSLISSSWCLYNTKSEGSKTETETKLKRYWISGFDFIAHRAWKDWGFK